MKRALRKVKWMAITILFPEFIFVKAVCELRFALFTLDKIYRIVQGSPEKFESVTQVEGTGHSVRDHWTWTVEFEPLKIRLYKLLLGSAPLVDFTTASTQPEKNKKNEKDGEYLPGPAFERSRVQYWTLTHAYYVNMGGIVAQKQKPRGDKLNPVIDYEYSVVRGDDFAVSDLKAWKFGHPLKELRLTVDDIKDKNKADWIVKTIAVIQIERLILDLITRRIGGQPVTQLEIATASFAVFAIVTHLVNWWKPKDITQPTAIHSVVDESKDGYLSRHPFFAPHLWSPGRRSHHDTDTMSRSNRIADDELWPDESNLSSTWSLMVMSCLVFGGLHCIAWSFWFPTRAEQLA